jgi:nitrite reductase/ring-hydroxylating ferredoxin subunit
LNSETNNPQNGKPFGARITPRRKFLKWVTFGTATSIIGGKLWRQDLLAHCDPGPGLSDGVFKIRVSDYPALGQAYGSVRLGLNPVSSYPDGDFYPILINRGASNDFYVLDCECRHESCVVPTFDMSLFCIQCECHGSQYWIDGSLLNGPAADPLFSYPFEYDGQYLTIHISCWGFSVQAAPAPSGSNGRIQITFTAHPNVTYQVNFSQKPGGPWTTTSFATTPTGPLNQTSLSNLGGDVSIYVNRPGAMGFFAVEMVLSEI